MFFNYGEVLKKLKTKIEQGKALNDEDKRILTSYLDREIDRTKKTLDARPKKGPDPIPEVEALLQSVEYRTQKWKLPTKEDLEKAVKFCWKALAQDNTYSRARIDMGIGYYLLEEYQKAVECWVFEADDDDPETSFYLYKGYRKLGRIWHALMIADLIANEGTCECLADLNELETYLENITWKHPNEIPEEKLHAIDVFMEKIVLKCWGNEEIPEFLYRLP